MYSSVHRIGEYRKAYFESAVGSPFEVWEQICSEFEGEILRGNSPHVETYHARYSFVPHRDSLLHQLLLLDLARRFSIGHPVSEQLIAFFPNLPATAILAAVDDFLSKQKAWARASGDSSVQNARGGERSQSAVASPMGVEGVGDGLISSRSVKEKEFGSSGSSAKSSPKKPSDTVAPVSREGETSLELVRLLRNRLDQTKPENRFRILREHAQGGLGIVYLAEDRELGREVALKQIRGDCANDPMYREKFTREAEVTGQLEHPGIIPVYALGLDASGSPFYAMRFVKGFDLRAKIVEFHEAVKSRQTSFDSVMLRQLLRRFISVCEAMAYAHHRGVIHRDLKPSNIMLGKYGETFVVDWGLARTFLREVGEGGPHRSPATPINPALSEIPLAAAGPFADSQTKIGSFLGTPAYASPEQLRGVLQELGPASDIYSLGAILYEILTGDPPVGKCDSHHRLADEILLGRIPPAISKNPSIPPSLDAVCRKAMAGKVENRYASVTELHRDIEAFLDDEVISAVRENWLNRTRRYLRKNQRVTSSVASFLIATVVFLVAVSVIVGQINVELENQKEELNRKNNELAYKSEELFRANAELELQKDSLESINKARLSALSEREEALAKSRKNEDVARIQSQLATDTINEIINEIEVGLDQGLDNSLVRQRLLARVLPRLSKLDREFVEEGAVHRQSVRAMINLAKSFLYLGRVDDSLSDLAMVPERQSMQGAASTSTGSTIVEGEPALLATKSDARPTDQIASNRQAVSLLDRAYQLATQYSKEHPADISARYDLLDVYPLLADAKEEAGNLEESVKLREELVEECKKLKNDFPLDRRGTTYAAKALLTLGQSRWSYSGAPTAIEPLQRASELAQSLYAQPSLEEDRSQIAASKKLHASILMVLGGAYHSQKVRQREAMQALQQSQEIVEDLLKDTEGEEDLDLLRLYARVLNTRASLLAAFGQNERSQELILEAISQYRRVMEVAPNDSMLRNSLAWALIGHADMIDDLSAQRAEYEEAIDLFEQSRRSNPNRREFLRDVSTGYERMGMLLIHVDRDQSKQWFERMLEIKDQLAKSDNGDLHAQQELAITYMHFGDLARAASDGAESLEWYGMEANLLRRLLKDYPNNTELRFSLAVSLKSIAEMYGGMQLVALEHLKQSQEVLQQLVAEHPQSLEPLRLLREVNLDLRNLNDWIKASSDVESIQDENSNRLRQLLLAHGRMAVRLRDYSDIRKTVNRMVSIAQDSRDGHMLAGMLLSLGAEVADAQARELKEAAKEGWEQESKKLLDESEQLKTLGLEHVEKAIQLGFSDLLTLRSRIELSFLRMDPRWSSIDAHSPQTRDIAVRLLSRGAILNVIDKVGSRSVNRVEDLPEEVHMISDVIFKGPPVTGEEIKGLAQARGLYKLNLESVAVEPGVLVSLKGCNSVSKILIGGEDKKVNEEDMQAMATLPNLQGLFLAGSSFSDSSAALFSELKQLYLLDVKSTRITDAGLDSIAKLISIGDLCLTDNAITDDGIAKIKNLELDILRLSETEITDRSLQLLSEMKSLSTLALSRTSISDSGLQYLATLPELSVIDLRETKVTAVGIENLAPLVSLTKLYTHGCPITLDDLAMLRKKLPFCEIDHTTEFIR